MGIEGAMSKASGLHYFAHSHVLKSPFSKEARGLRHNPVMFCGGLFGGVPHFPASSIYDDHHTICMTVIIVQWPAIKEES
jgi:hypothetical protein